MKKLSGFHGSKVRIKLNIKSKIVQGKQNYICILKIKGKGSETK